MPAKLICTLIALNTVLLANSFGQSTPSVAPRLISVKKIWHGAEHNAFTDLIRFHDKWFCTFRESQAHVGGNGKIRIIVSDDAEHWASAALIAEEGVDLRDPKLSIMPDQRLMLNLGGSVYDGTVLKGRQSRAAFSSDGTNWTSPQTILEKGDWLWRVTWRRGIGYGIAYSTSKPATEKTDPHAGMTAKLVATRDGVIYHDVTPLEISGSPNESTLRFVENGNCIALVRRETDDKAAWIGLSHAPYKQWTWRPAGLRIGGPNFIFLENNSMVASGRRYGATGADAKTFVGRMDTERVQPDLTLPSGGDCSYAGMVWHEGFLWVSYYSSHEGATDIYFAKVDVSNTKP